MKKSIRLIATLFISMVAVTTQAQIWNAPDANGTVTTNTTTSPVVNSVVVGPLPTTPSNLHINSTAVVGSSSNTSVTIENSGSAIAKGAYLTFKNAGVSYSIGTNSFPAAGSQMFHIGNLIHMNTGQITFSSGYSPEYTGIYATSKYNFRGGMSAFDSIYASRIGVDMVPPVGYNFGAWGNSYFQNKVVIGTTNRTLPTSTYKLYVGGTAICEELIVKLQSSWPDFVFAPNYKLMPLNEVKTYITENKHLPNVPAACEVDENGVATGQMLTIQMKKIEELTLYLIQMQEQNQAMQKEIDALKKVSK